MQTVLLGILGKLPSPGWPPTWWQSLQPGAPNALLWADFSYSETIELPVTGDIVPLWQAMQACDA